MADFRPRQGPEFQDPDLRSIVKWMEGELGKLVRTQQDVGTVPFQVRAVEPDKPRDGQLVYADGTTWDPGSGRGTYERVNGVWQRVGGIQDGDYGDITVSGGGVAFTIDNDVVTNAKLANMAAARVKARGTASTGDPEDIPIGNGLVLDATSLRTLQQMSLTVDGSGLKLVNDSSSPGNSKYYGTDSGGTKGFVSLPTSLSLVTTVAASGASADFLSLPTATMFLLVFKNVSHNSGGTANLRVALSPNNGSSYGSAQTIGTAVSNAVLQSGLVFIARIDQGSNPVIWGSAGNGIINTILDGTAGIINALQVTWSAGSHDAGSIDLYKFT